MRRTACRLAIFVALLSTVVDPLDARSPVRKEIDRTADDYEPHQQVRDVRKTLPSRSDDADDQSVETLRDPPSKKTATGSPKRDSAIKNRIFQEFMEEIDSDLPESKRKPNSKTVGGNQKKSDSKVKVGKEKPKKSTAKIPKGTDEEEEKTSDTDGSPEASRSESVKPAARLFGGLSEVTNTEKNNRAKGQQNNGRDPKGASARKNKYDPPSYNGKRSAKSRNQNTNTNVNTNINNNVNDILIGNLGPLRHQKVKAELDQEKDDDENALGAAIALETPENAVENPRQTEGAENLATDQSTLGSGTGLPKKPRKKHGGHGKKQKKNRQPKPSQLSEEREPSEQQETDNLPPVDIPTKGNLGKESTASAVDKVEESAELSPLTPMDKSPAEEVESDESARLTQKILDLLVEEKGEMSPSKIQHLKRLLDELDVEDKRMILLELGDDTSEKSPTKVKVLREKANGKKIVGAETKPQETVGVAKKPVSKESELSASENADDLKSSDDDNREDMTNEAVGSSKNAADDEKKAKVSKGSSAKPSINDDSDDKVNVQSPEEAAGIKLANGGEPDRAGEQANVQSSEEAGKKKSSGDLKSEEARENKNVLGGGEEKTSADLSESDGVAGKKTVPKEKSTDDLKSDTPDVNDDLPSNEATNTAGDVAAAKLNSTDGRGSDGANTKQKAGENQNVPTRDRKSKVVTEDVERLSKNQTTRRNAVGAIGTIEEESTDNDDEESDDEATISEKRSEINRPRGRQRTPSRSRLDEDDRLQDDNVNSNVNTNMNSNLNANSHRLSAPSRRRLVASKTSRRSIPQDSEIPERPLMMWNKDSVSTTEQPTLIKEGGGLPSRISKNANNNNNVNTNKVTLRSANFNKNDNVNDIGIQSSKPAGIESDLKNTRRSSSSRLPRQRNRLSSVNSNSNVNNIGVSAIDNDDEYNKEGRSRRTLGLPLFKGANSNKNKNTNINSNTNTLTSSDHGGVSHRDRAKDGSDERSQKTTTSPSSIPLGKEGVELDSGSKLQKERNMRSLHKRHNDMIYLER